MNLSNHLRSFFFNQSKLHRSVAKATPTFIAEALESRMLLSVSFAPASSYVAGADPACVATGHFNTDSTIDLAVANYGYGGSVGVLLGNGNGTFQPVVNYAAGNAPSSIAAGNFTGDGHTDLAVADFGGGVSVLLGNGNGTFQAAVNYATGSEPQAVTVGDFNGDGKPDLAVANEGDGTVSILLGNGNGTFQAAVNYAVGNEPMDVTVGNFNGDGKADLAVANYAGNTVSVLLGNGNGTFQPAVSYAAGNQPRSVAVGDFNDDGRTDLAVADQGGGVSVLRGNGNGTFKPALNFDPSAGLTSVAAGDFNGDGNTDLAVTNASGNTASVLLGSGNGIFQAAGSFTVGTQPVAIAVGDFNTDSRPDLAVANFGGNNISVLLNSTVATPAFSNLSASSSVVYGTASVTFGGKITAGTFTLPTTETVAITLNGVTQNAAISANGNFSATFNTSALPVMATPYPVTYAYAGDGNFTAVANNTATALTAQKTTTTTVVTSAGSTCAYDSTLILTATVTPGSGSDPTGMVQFQADGGNVGLPAALVGNTATYATPSLALGNHTLTAIYFGDGNFNGSTSGVWTQTITPVPWASGNVSLFAAPVHSYTTGGNSCSVATGDFNGDGKIDLAVVNEGTWNGQTYVGGSVSVLLGNGNGTFQPAVNYTVGSEPPLSVAAGDFNGDGKLDLAVTTVGSYNGTGWADCGVNVLLGNGNGTFQAPVNYAVDSSPNSVTAGDFNGDGNTDLVVADQDAVSVLLGNGNGTFQPAVDYFAIANNNSVTVGDFNGDGIEDLAVADEGVYSDGTYIDSGVNVLLGNGNGTFQPAVCYAAGTSPSSVTVGDFNGDGKADLAVADQLGGVNVLLGNGNGTFQPAVVYTLTSAPQCITVGDFNGDGKTDLAVADQSGVSVLLGNGNGAFGPEVYYGDAYGPCGVTVGDFNADGRPDLAWADYDAGTVRTLQNTTMATPVFSNLTPSSSINYGTASVTFGGKITAGNFTPSSTETVAITLDGVTQNAAISANGNFSVAFNTSALPGFTPYQVTYAYAGDGNFTALTDNTTTVLTVNRVAVTTMLTSSNSTWTCDGAAALTATVTPGSGSGPTGMVQFLVDGNNLGLPVALVDNIATYATSSLALATGSHTLTAVYSGDGEFAPSTSATLTQIVTPAPWASGNVSFLAQSSGAMLDATRFVTVGDFNADGKTDLLATYKYWLNGLIIGGAWVDSLWVQLGNGDGTFQASVDPHCAGPMEDPGSSAVGDFNGDGKSDVVVVDSGNGVGGLYQGADVLLGNGDGTFQRSVRYAAGSDPYFVAVGDFNGDGNADLAVANHGSNNVSVLLGNGDGTFQAAVNYAVGSEPYSVSVGDFNGDGNTDLAVADSGSNNVSVLLGNGDGTFQAAVNYATGTKPESVTVGDFNGDGNADLAVANYGSNNVSLLLGNGDGTFQAAVNYAAGTKPDSVTVGDFNGDGNADLAVANYGSNNVSLLLGNGDGTFQAAVNYAAGTQPDSVTVGDFNGDGRPDLAVADYGGGVSILLNTTMRYPAFSNLSASSSVNYGTPLATFGGTIATSNLTAPTNETVAITLNGVTQNAVTDANGNFTTTFNTSTLPASATPYHVTYAYAGDANFAGITDNTTTTLNVFSLPWLSPGSAVTWNAAAQTLTLTGNGTITGDPGKSGVQLTIDDSAAVPLVVDTQVADGGDGDAVVHLANVIGNGTVSVNGTTGLLVNGNFTAAALANSGTVELDGIAALGQLSGSGNLTIGNGSSRNTLQLTAATTPDSFANTQQALTINAGSILDITNNMLLLNYGSGSSPLAAVQAAVVNQTIFSSTANTGRLGQYTVGYADSTELSSIASGNVEVMYTLVGDANLDGRVNFNDFSLLQNNYDQSGRDWSQGDYNHDGLVNFNDFSLLQNNYDQNIAAAIFSSVAIGSATASAASSTAAAASSAMPFYSRYSPASQMPLFTNDLIEPDGDAAVYA